MGDSLLESGKEKTPTGPSQAADSREAGATTEPPEASRGPGEFTQMFGGSVKQPPESSIQSSGRVESELPPGEFTRLFKLPEIDAAVSEPAKTGLSSESSAVILSGDRLTPSPGEFSRLFRSPKENKPTFGGSELAEPAGKEFPGQFTKVFRSAPLDAFLPARGGVAVPPPPAGDPARGVFGDPSAQPEIPRQPVLQVPSEFTRVIAVPSSASPAAESVERRADPPQPEPPKTVSPWPLIITLNILFLMAVTLVLYFALRR